MTDAVKQRLGQLRALLDMLDQRREKADGEPLLICRRRFTPSNWPLLTAKQHSEI